MLSQLVIEEIRLGFSQGDFMLNVPPNEVHRNEWGELVCNVYDEDNIFLYTEKMMKISIKLMVLLYLLTGQDSKTKISRSLGYE